MTVQEFNQELTKHRLKLEQISQSSPPDPGTQAICDRLELQITAILDIGDLLLGLGAGGM